MRTFDVVIDGDVIAEAMPRRAAEGIAAGLLEVSPKSDVAIVPHDDSPDAGPAALRAMFPL